MKRFIITVLVVVDVAVWASTGLAVAPQVAELNFDSHFAQSAEATNGLPPWVVGVRQQGGQFLEQPKCWYVDSSQPVGQGRLSITLDRQLMQEDLALTMLYEENEAADLIVQLLDANDDVIVLDLFANIVVVGKEAKTDTFIVPLRQYPTVTKIAIRRIKGEIKVYGAALYPVVGQAAGDVQTLQDLAKLLGDPLSPDNPLVRAIHNIAVTKDLSSEVLKQIPGSKSQPGDGGQPRVIEQAAGQLWEVLPWLKNSDWGGPTGNPAVVGENELLLLGRPVRRHPSYSTPITLECEFWLEKRVTSDGAFCIQFIRADEPKDSEPAHVIALNLFYRNPGVFSGKDEIGAFHFEGSISGPMIWSSTDFSLEAGVTYRLKIQASAEKMLVQVNDRNYEVNNGGIPYKDFYVQMHGWQPANRWHVRNFVVH